MLLNGIQRHSDSLIKRIGKQVTVREYALSGPSYDPTRTAVNIPAWAARFEYDQRETFDGSIIQRDDVLYVIVTSVPLTKQHKIVDEGKEYHIVTLETVATGESTYQYRAQCRL